LYTVFKKKEQWHLSVHKEH